MKSLITSLSRFHSEVARLMRTRLKVLASLFSRAFSVSDKLMTIAVAANTKRTMVTTPIRIELNRRLRL